ncbi:nuclear transport factor 2 family protein [Inquilinus sp. Marseille-Q2685]|uniref:YybH family protein n=1 Tax=Inquilinus sp. Marseille-Q2685 TaxID=2866581 RepID=UPI001CE3E5FF|nr:nuclear transport factor 2 family protein [Inquilinus sp. Marseille-Q2685]
MTGQHDSESEIRALIEERAAALRRKDAEGFVARQAADYALFSLYSMGSPLAADQASVEDVDGWFATWYGPIGYEVRDLDIAAGGDVAFCHGFARMSGTKTDGETVDLWFRLTLGLRRTTEGWTIVHEHESVPFYMDGSLRAAVDLKP